MLDEEHQHMCSSSPLCWGAPFKVADWVGGATNMALVMVAGTHTLRGKWRVDSERSRTYDRGLL